MPADRLFSGCQFGHFGLDGCQVGLLDYRLARVYVIVEAVLDGGPDAELYARVHLLQRLCQQVRARVPEGVFALGIVPFVEDDSRILVDGACQVIGLTVDTTREHLLRKALAYALCYLKTGHSGLVLADRTVGKSDLYHNCYI